jgi:ribonuclease P/MRP protein subunit RPP40
VTNLLEFSHELSITVNDKTQTDVIYLDYAKAFDTVSHSLLIDKLNIFKIYPTMIKLLSSYLQNRSQIICIDSIFSNPVKDTSGVPQGTLLGPFLFITYVSDLPKCLQFAKCLTYADDTKIFMRVRNIADCLLLQRDLNSIYEWCQRWKLRLNLDKCEIMTVTNRANTLEFVFHMDDVRLERVSHVSDLGIVFESNLSFDMHIDKIWKSASRVMGVIRRSCSTDFDAYTVKRLYVAIVRPILEYASTVWNTQFSTKVDRVERIQRVLLRLYCDKFRLQFDSVCLTLTFVSLQAYTLCKQDEQ